MDVWFDSGSSWNGVVVNRPELTYPADLYLEGSDQYRGWFNSSLITSVANHGVAPYKQILSQGFALDGKGEKMSKSLGNTIAPSDVEKQFGAEILRLWVTSVDSSNDVRISMDILSQVSETYRKIRNTLRFLIANTSDFNPAQDTVAYDELRSVDKYMTIRFNQLVKIIRDAYANFEFLTIYKALVNFINVDLSAFYLDFAKDVVYIEGAKSLERRQMQTVFYDILVKITKLLTQSFLTLRKKSGHILSLSRRLRSIVRITKKFKLLLTKKKSWIHGQPSWTFVDKHKKPWKKLVMQKLSVNHLKHT